MAGGVLLGFGAGAYVLRFDLLLRVLLFYVAFCGVSGFLRRCTV